MKNNKTMTIDHLTVPVGEERNLLEVIRKANIELPTFCYHSEMSIYGACRLCMVDIQGRGLQPACSTLPEEGMVVRTNTQEIRTMRKMIIELLLASHAGNCPTCVKGINCRLQKLAQRMGITTVRFRNLNRQAKVDTTSPALIRDPNKCILCGDCVRMCNEIQSVGAIDFVYRGAQAAVMPCFGKDLAEVECISCGQCARVCPTGALLPKPSIEEVWQALHDQNKTVVAQIAPAVRVALGESFGLEPGTLTTGRLITALKRMGFAKVFDTAFAADLTVIEEGEEFLGRLANRQKLPQFSSCCPGWVKFAEQYYPELLSNLSSCSSPQQMMGALCKYGLSGEAAGKDREIVVVAVMPCTAKKYEVQRPEFTKSYGKNVDFILTTQELTLMIKEMGMQFNHLEQSSFDLPFGFQTGGGVIFGNSGGVTEAVLRYAAEKITGEKNESYVFKTVRGQDGIREAHVALGPKTLSLAVVSGLGNARKVIEKIKNGEAAYDFVEVMACPGGCINGGGQPVSKEADVKEKRTRGLYDNDQMLQLHNPQENPYVAEVYENLLKKAGSVLAHQMLHTHYHSQKRIDFQTMDLAPDEKASRLAISICFGTSCLLRGAQTVFSEINRYLNEQGDLDKVRIKATFCFESCTRGPVLKIGSEVLEKCTPAKAIETIQKYLD